MDIDKLKLLRELKKNKKVLKNDIFAKYHFSQKKINNLLFELVKDELIINTNNCYILTDKAHNLMELYRVNNAIILAAGFGSRFVPLTYETPKGLLEVHGEKMIERQIKQLLEESITDITIVVGYLKEKFNYLIDKYGVKIIYNDEYNNKNNLSSLFHVRHLLNNTYILSSDNYMTKNLFNTFEFESWYSAIKAESETKEWCLTVDTKDRISAVNIGGTNAWHMYGPVYFSKKFSKKIVPLIENTYLKTGTDDYYWEDVLMQNINELEMYVNRQPENVVYEFESLEELREFDSTYKEESKSKVMLLISSIFQVKEIDIEDIKPLKQGMTNKSFLFRIKNKKYICRIPGEGTENLINRAEEYLSIQAVVNLEITEKIIYINLENGIKISEFENGARNLNMNSEIELIKSLKTLKKLHNSDITVPHCFNIEESILFYEKLCIESGAFLFEDYSLIREKMNELICILNSMKKPLVFCHIDAHYDNFLVLPNGDLKLIDWEYAGMCDPIIDLSMFSLYGNLDGNEIEKIINYYFEEGPSQEESLRIFIYIALGGFLWAMWAQFKQTLGVEFKEYSINMYNYAKEYYKKSMEFIKENKIEYEKI